MVDPDNLNYNENPNYFLYQNSLYGIVKIPSKDCAKCTKLFRISVELLQTFVSVWTSDSNEICTVEHGPWPQAAYWGGSGI